MKVVVGSTNPVKKQATLEAFEKVFPKDTWQIVGKVTVMASSPL